MFTVPQVIIGGVILFMVFSGVLLFGKTISEFIRDFVFNRPCFQKAYFCAYGTSLREEISDEIRRQLEENGMLSDTNGSNLSERVVALEIAVERFEEGEELQDDELDTLKERVFGIECGLDAAPSEVEVAAKAIKKARKDAKKDMKKD